MYKSQIPWIPVRAPFEKKLQNFLSTLFQGAPSKEESLGLVEAGPAAVARIDRRIDLDGEKAAGPADLEQLKASEAKHPRLARLPIRGPSRTT